MKALLASALTALILVTTAWASNVTPGQLTALSKRVATLQRRVNSLQSNLEANDSTVSAVQVRETKGELVLKCLQTQWNATKFEDYSIYTSDGFGTTSGDVSMYAAPAVADGIARQGYLLESDGLLPQC